MKLDKTGPQDFGLDATDERILTLLQSNCKQPLAEIGKQVGLTAPSVVDRIHKLEGGGVIRAYVALVDARRVGKDVTAFIGVSIHHPTAVESFEKAVHEADDVLECHHVTGEHTFMLKVKTESTATLEQLIGSLRSIDGVSRTETMVVLSSHIERTRICVDAGEGPDVRRHRRAGVGRSKRGGTAAEQALEEGATQ